MRRAALAAALAAAVFGCRNLDKNPLEGFSGEVSCQRPRTVLRFTEPTGRDSLLLAQVGRFIDGRPVVLDSLASACQFSAKEAGEGWSMMGGFEDGSGGLHLVYFNRYRRERIMAGRKMHLCFDRNRELKEIYVYEVPLE